MDSKFTNKRSQVQFYLVYIKFTAHLQHKVPATATAMVSVCRSVQS
jgi:hypothetical protein